MTRPTSRMKDEDERLRAQRREAFSSQMDADLVMEAVKRKGLLLDLTEEERTQLRYTLALYHSLLHIC